MPGQARKVLLCDRREETEGSNRKFPQCLARCGGWKLPNFFFLWADFIVGAGRKLRPVCGGNWTPCLIGLPRLTGCISATDTSTASATLYQLPYSKKPPLVSHNHRTSSNFSIASYLSSLHCKAVNIKFLITGIKCIQEPPITFWRITLRNIRILNTSPFSSTC